MSISTQPNARHASLPRGAPARMSAASTMEVAAPRSGPADEMQRPRATMMDYAFRPQPLGNATAGIPFNNSGPSCMPKPTEPPAQRLLPALATELASQLQARKRASLNSQLSCSSESGPAQHAVATVPVAGPCDLLNQSSKRPRLSPVTSPAARLAQQAAFLEDEFVAMKAGTAVIADKTAWVAAARHTAHQVTNC